MRLRDNIRFLVIEVEALAQQTFALLESFDAERFERIAAKDDYIDNLKTTIENECFSRIHGGKALEPGEIQRIRSIQVICVNLERIADFCVAIARQTDYLSQYSFLDDYDLASYFRIIQGALGDIIPVFEKQDMAGALGICKAEYDLDTLYAEHFAEILGELQESPHVQNLITVVFILRYLERIGDALLNVGEAILFSITGDRIKIGQFEALKKTLASGGLEGSAAEMDWYSFWGSRSGCRISRIEGKNFDYPQQWVFKEGDLKKIKKEKRNIEKWATVRPGLAPRIYGYQEDGPKASLLVEFLRGSTLEELVLTAGRDERDKVLTHLEALLDTVWKATRSQEAIATDYMQQLKSRKTAVRVVHPSFWRDAKAVGHRIVASSDDLVQGCDRIERSLPAPFSVFIHGDFNVNNILVNPVDGHIHFIDLYRSKDADYVQDASVFLLSNFRIPTTDRKLRERLNEVIERFWSFFRGFAAAASDTTFEARMALALARSFYTSTRFEMNTEFAEIMYLRSMFLLEKIAAHRGAAWEAFRLPADVLFT
jgi:phosphate uptake regulator/Ser/Thr protein kinase RdoA (MazF antagonist)